MCDEERCEKCSDEPPSYCDDEMCAVVIEQPCDSNKKFVRVAVPSARAGDGDEQQQPGTWCCVQHEDGVDAGREELDQVLEHTELSYDVKVMAVGGILLCMSLFILAFNIYQLQGDLVLLERQIIHLTGFVTSGHGHTDTAPGAGNHGPLALPRRGLTGYLVIQRTSLLQQRHAN